MYDDVEDRVFFFFRTWVVSGLVECLNGVVLGRRWLDVLSSSSAPWSLPSSLCHSKADLFGHSFDLWPLGF